MSLAFRCEFHWRQLRKHDINTKTVYFGIDFHCSFCTFIKPGKAYVARHTQFCTIPVKTTPSSVTNFTPYIQRAWRLIPKLMLNRVRIPSWSKPNLVGELPVTVKRFQDSLRMYVRMVNLSRKVFIGKRVDCWVRVQSDSIQVGSWSVRRIFFTPGRPTLQQYGITILAA